MEPVNHWRPVTSEYQLEFMPPMQALAAPRKRRRTRAEAAQEAARKAGAAPLAISCIQWFYFFRACVCFVLGSVLLSYPSSGPAVWLIAHARILVPFTITGTEAAPLINLLAETFFILSIVSAVIGVMWLMRSPVIRWITMCYTGALLARTALYFVAIGATAPWVLLSLHQKQVLLTGAVVNLLIFGYMAFYPGVEQASESAPSESKTADAIPDRAS
jgi:hypothetical protein